MTTRDTIDREADLQGWLRSKLSRSGDGALRVLELRHMIGGREGPLVDDWSESDFRTVPVPELGRMLFDTARKHASRLAGRQYYYLFPYFGESRVAAGGYPIEFFEHDKSSRSEDGMHSDPANEVGALAVMMRAFQSSAAAMQAMAASTIAEMRQMATATVAQSHQVLTTVTGLWGQDRARLKDIEDQRIPMIQAFEATLSQEHERKLMSHLAISEEENKREVVGLIKMLGPAVVNQFAGKKVLPEHMTTDMMFMREMAAQIDEESMKGLLMLIESKKPGMGTAFVTMVERWKEEHEQMQKAAAAEVASKGVGETSIRSIQVKRSLAEGAKRA